MFFVRLFCLPGVISTMMIFLHIFLLHFHQHALAYFSLAFKDNLNTETLPKFYTACPLTLQKGRNSFLFTSLRFLTKHSGDIGNLDLHLKHYLFSHTFLTRWLTWSIQPCSSFCIHWFLWEHLLCLLWLCKDQQPQTLACTCLWHRAGKSTASYLGVLVKGEVKNWSSTAM